MNAEQPDMSDALRRALTDLESWEAYLREWDQEKDHWSEDYWDREHQRRIDICTFWRGVIARIRELEGK